MYDAGGSCGDARACAVHSPSLPLFLSLSRTRTTHTYTHTHTYAHTHARTHARALFIFFSPPLCLSLSAPVQKCIVRGVVVLCVCVRA